MSLRIYNTLTRTKEPFTPLEEGKVSLYVCGPTVYSDAHVGHAMSVLVFDIVRRYLTYRGYDVTHAMNYTDVDDKIIMRANETGQNPYELAEKHIQEFKRHLDDLNVLQATVNPRATEEMDTILDMITQMIDKGFAYELDGDVYFRVNKKNDYGKLSGRKIDDMLAGTRIDVNDRKETPMDFALWKAVKPDEPAWESPWGLGRPGWHIECSAMNLNHLGPQIDIHGGGNDLIFPHHENEIAQTECVTGKKFASVWMHNGMLQLSGEKMSKSLGNLVTVDEFLARYDGDVLRFLVLNGNYRSPLMFSWDIVEQGKRALDRMRNALKPALPNADGADDALASLIETTQTRFTEAMDDDFNTAGAMGALFDLVRGINAARDKNASEETLQPAQAKLLELTGVLGLTLAKSDDAQAPVMPFIDLLVEVRSEIRTQKLWALSDKIRDELKNLGVIIEDSRDGSTWHWE